MTDTEIVKRELFVHETLSALSIWQPDVNGLVQYTAWPLLLAIVFPVLVMQNPSGWFFYHLLLGTAVLAVVSFSIGYAIHKMRNTPSRLRLSAATIAFGHRSIPLEDVQDVVFNKEDDGIIVIEIRLHEETIRRSYTISQNAGAALVRIVRKQVARRKDTLTREGANLQQVVKPQIADKTAERLLGTSSL